MEFSFGIPTKIYFGKDCIAKNAGVLAAVGSKAMIVTGKHSAKASGALDDVTAVLEAEKKEYVIFDEIENNPSVETVAKAADIARAEKIDFVIGIGGGSPIDASKAIAVLAANADMAVTDLLKMHLQRHSRLSEYLQRQVPEVRQHHTACS